VKCVDKEGVSGALYAPLALQKPKCRHANKLGTYSLTIRIRLDEVVVDERLQDLFDGLRDCQIFLPRSVNPQVEFGTKVITNPFRLRPELL
jgi:hypothetical protein